MLKDLFHDAVRNFLAVFKGRNLFWHALAIVLTAILVFSGLDWWYYEHTRSGVLFWIVLGAGLGGFVVPIFVPLGMYVWARYRRDVRVSYIALATAQASAIGYIISTIYKVFTGRTQPVLFTQVSNIDISHAFHFGILQNGVFWGWPSSHAATAFAGVVCFALLVRSKPLRVLAIAYAIFVGFGASIGFHWLSDVVAGIIFGTLVGVIVAKSYSDVAIT
jgi:membrane-associated phospholipid phosphatase